MKKEEVKEALNYMKKYKKIWEISEDSDIEQNYPSLKKYIDSCLFQKDYSLVYAWFLIINASSKYNNWKMHPKRKNTNKENKKQTKRVPLATILPSYTEDIPLTGYQSA